MSLLEESFEPCTLLTKTVIKDDYGGYETVWADGVDFEAAIVFNISLKADQAEAAGVKSRYTVTTKRTLTLEFHDVFRRETDGKIFRVTTDGDDKYTPKMSTLDMRQVKAEEWTLPNE